MKKIKTIAVFTSIRSEYGPLSSLLHKLKQDNQFELQLLVGGAHLKEEYGMTINQIISDGFIPFKEFPFLYPETSVDHISQSIAELQRQMGLFLVIHKPDLIVVLGDRFELIPVALSALLYNIPIAHISGGDTTEGAIDNQIRHALTKMSHIHFPATEVYKQNLLKMGEEPWRICVSGEPALDEVLSLSPIPKIELFQILGLDINKPTICCTFHPETISNLISPEFVKELLISVIVNTKYQILVTAANFDSGGSEINTVLEELSSHNERIVYVKSLGQKKYYSLLRYVDLMLGNSSSGIIEAQSFGLPVVNVGNRQKGRLQNPNILNAEINILDVLNKIEESGSLNFKDSFKGKENIYGSGNASDIILSFLKNVPLDTLLTKKDNFY